MLALVAERSSTVNGDTEVASFSLARSDRGTDTETPISAAQGSLILGLAVIRHYFP